MLSGDVTTGTSAYRVTRARTIPELEEAARVRWTVFSEAMRLEPGFLPALREVNGFDVLDTTENFVCYRGEDLAGTIRLLRPNSHLAGKHGVALGLPLEIQYQVEGLPAQASIAELGRAAIMPAHRGTPAIGKLYKAAYEASRQIGVTHWLAVSLTETDSLEDTRIVLAMLRARGRTAPEPRLLPRSNLGPSSWPSRPLYTPEQRRRAAEGDFDGLALPHTVRFLLGIGLTFVGEPVFETAFKEYVLPVLLPLDAFAASVFGRRYVAERGVAERRVAERRVTECPPEALNPSTAAPLPAA